MKNRKASDRMAECIIEMVHEYKQRIEFLNRKFDVLAERCKEEEKRRVKAVDQTNTMSDKLGEIADIIAGITEHDNDGCLKIYLSDLLPENAIKLERLFQLLDIPMTAEQTKDGDIIE